MQAYDMAVTVADHFGRSVIDPDYDLVYAILAQVHDLDAGEIRETTNEFEGDVTDAIDHLLRLREYHEHYTTA